MRVNQLLVNLLNSVLGPSRNTSGSNYSYKCPKCKQRKNKLEVNLDQETKHFQSYQCWVCGDDFSGKSLLKLFRRLKASQEQAIEELQQCSGTQFDPKITHIFINLLKHGTKPTEPLVEMEQFTDRVN